MKDFLKQNGSHIIIITILSIIVLLIGAQFLWTGTLNTSALDQTLNDQTGYITTARNIAENGKYESSVYYPAKMPYKSHNLPYMPGNYYIRAVFFYFLGYSIFNAFLPNLLAFISSAILLFLISIKYFDRKAAYSSLFLFLLFPPFVLYSFTAMMEILFVFACLLSFYIFINLPLKLKYRVGCILLIPIIFIRETAIFMLIGFSIIIFLEEKNKREIKVMLFFIVSAVLLFAIFLLPIVADRPSALLARLTDSGNLYFYDAYALQDVNLKYSDIISIIILHFIDNIKYLKFSIFSWPWGIDFSIFILILFLFISNILLLFKKSVNKMFISFIAITFTAVLFAMFFLYDYYNYTGIRILLFMVPFSFCALGYIFVKKIPINKNRKLSIRKGLIFLFVMLYISFFITSLYKFQNNFDRAVRFDKACGELLDSIGISKVRFFSAPSEISLDYVNNHYPIRWSFMPANEKTLKLIDDNYNIDILILPYGHGLAFDAKSKRIKNSILNDKFKLKGYQIFMNQLLIVYKPDLFKRGNQ